VQWLFRKFLDIHWISNGYPDNYPDNPLSGPFTSLLWTIALDQDRSFSKIKKAIEGGNKRFPPKLKLQVTIAECSLDEKGRPRFRERLWAPDYEPLRTRIIQDTHDSIVTGHPGRDLLVSILSRRFYWPGLSQDVRRFVRNCDGCGSKKPWRERK